MPRKSSEEMELDLGLEFGEGSGRLNDWRPADKIVSESSALWSMASSTAINVSR